MKKAMKIVMSLVMIMLLCGTAMASDFNAQGSALIPGLEYWVVSNSNYGSQRIILNNITRTDVTCRFSLYDHDGNDISHLVNVYKGGPTNHVMVSNGGADVAIPAGASRLFTLKVVGVANFTIGYAKVQWKSADVMLQKALIGTVREFRRDHGGPYTGGNLLINNGQPF
ncbi:hypothetical protein [Maridesulfovibrio sp.]|uniref:hypothetical protein n=1 Tax=Maridesulfovibrio sp. TaxID=2795000 RepID=UPI003AFFD7BF